MPINRQITKEQVATYASVLLDGVQQAGGQESVLEVRDQLDGVVRLVRSNMDLQSALGDSTLAPEQRSQTARAVFADANPALVDVLAVMAERDDMGLLSRVNEAYKAQLEERLGLSVVDVTTVVALDDHLREVIAKKAEADLGTKVVLREHIDASLLGGILMNANGKRIDASVATQLERARTVLADTSNDTEDGGERS